MASLIKTNKISTPGGEEFTLPTTYPSSTVDLTSTSGGQLGYGTANPIVQNMSTSTGKIAERFCDKLRVNNSSSTVANATLSALPSDVTDVSSIVRTQVDFAGVCFVGNATPYLQLLDASNNNVIGNSYSYKERRQENYSSGSTGTLNNATSGTANSNGFKLTYTQAVVGASKSGEIFTKTANENDLGLMCGYITISQYNTSDGAGIEDNAMLIESCINYNYNGTYTSSTRGCIVHKWVRYYNTSGATINPYTQIKIYDLSGNNISEGMFTTYSYINVNK
tara:strand:+ start:1248 stop:2087 length:840 start_codon:yes stop_codon:yes gene_type:complete